MIDKVTNKPFKITPQEGGWPYIRLPLEQLEDVRHVLDAHGIRYHTSGSGVNFDNGPYIALIDLAYKTDVAKLQAILDAA